jgi:hypothetical protein
VTIIGCVYIVTGAISLADQAIRLSGQYLFQFDVLGI